MSKQNPGSPSQLNSIAEKDSSIGSARSVQFTEELDPSETPDFIYGGPFIKQNLSAGFFMDSITPINSKLEGSYKKGVAYRALTDRMPVILTKIIDRISKIGGPDASSVISQIAELKNALVTNKMYEPLKATTEDALRWNAWVEATPCHNYFNNSWLFTECYIYRRVRDILETSSTLKNEDPFSAQKEQAFKDTLEASCIAAEELATMLQAADNAAAKQQNQQHFSLLVKMCLWSNKCDLSLSAGSAVKIGDGKKGEGARAMDPVRWVEEFKANVIVDDSLKVPLEFKVGKPINPNDPKLACTCNQIAKAAKLPICQPPVVPGESKTALPPAPPVAPVPPDGEAPPDKVPCPARIVDIQTFFVDIICDNAGLELVCDLILGDFLIQKQIAHKVRYHVKAIPWFVSDVTPADFRKVIKWCSEAQYSREAPGELPPPPPPPKGAKASKKPPPPPEPAEPVTPPPPRPISSEALVAAATRWQDYFDNGVFILETDQFWTTPLSYIHMKKNAYNLFRRLQYSQLVVFKGDLNYRKLLDDTRVNPNLSFEKSLKGFFPAPILAIRTVKCDLVAGLSKGKADQLTAKDPTWMENGDYGVIQYCKKKDALKPAEKPCFDYGYTCFGTSCPVHHDIY